jgi:hypothetical protein
MRREFTKPQGGVLPDGYTQLEYIESTGTQWINTGIGVCPNIETYMMVNYYQNPTDAYNYGVYYNNDSDTLAANYRTRNYGNLDFRAGLSYQTPIIQLVLNTDYLIEQTKTEFAITNMANQARVSKPIITKKSGSGNSRPIYLFCVNLRGSAAALMSFRCKRFWIQANDIFLWDGVPALRESDSKPGLYDVVNDTFYTNAGTGEFLYA